MPDVPDGPSDADDRPGPSPRRAPPSRTTLRLVVAGAVITYVMAQLGDALFPSLVKDNPELLLFLNARLRSLVGVANEVNTVYFFVVGTFRMLASDPLFFLLGYWYGDAIVTWMESRTPSTGRAVRRYEKYFRDAAYPIVVVAPTSITAVLAGSAGMRPAVFIALNFVGSFGRVVLVKIFGEQFSDQIDAVTTWISDNRLYLLPITIGIVVVAFARDALQGRREMKALEHLVDDDPRDDTGGDD